WQAHHRSDPGRGRRRERAHRRLNPRRHVMAIPFAVPIPFMALLGCELQRYDHGEAEGTRALRDDQHTNSFGVAHGGVIMTLLDVAMAHAARSLHKDRPDGGPGLVTIELKTTFMRPGQGVLRAQGSVLHG